MWCGGEQNQIDQINYVSVRILNCDGTQTVLTNLAMLIVVAWRRVSADRSSSFELRECIQQIAEFQLTRSSARLGQGT